jgi:3D-(3,5/4)-trihydroxycyclohexane-1,2-dione acylhydrolase (decyclizing)
MSVRLTAAQAMVRYLAAQQVEVDGRWQPYFAGAWAIFGHGNVAALGAALAEAGDALPTYRAHNEQAMAHAAIAFAKQARRRRAMACTTSIGPGATNMVTAAALAHVNRLPVLFLPGDVFAGRRPDPVLQQVEDFGDGTVTANDCFRPVSRYFDRIVRPEQLLDCLPRAMATLLDPASCGPVTLAFCQDVQAEAFGYPESFFSPTKRRIPRPHPDPSQVEELAGLLEGAKHALFIMGGGVAYSGAAEEIAGLAQRRGIAIAETQAGKGCIAWDHPCNLGALGVTGTSAANAAAAAADVVVGWGTRLQDFTTGSRALFSHPGRRLAQVNVAPFDAAKHDALPVVGDALATARALSARLAGSTAPATAPFAAERRQWDEAWSRATGKGSGVALTDAQVLGAVWRAAPDDAIVVCAAGGLPGELHKLWRVRKPGGYHLEYGYSCMGYEIAGGLGVKMAEPSREVYVMVGDGSYLMMNSEIATSVMLGHKLVIVVLDNHGYGCIHRLQAATGGEPFNNLFESSRHARLPQIDFVAHAASLGAVAERARDADGLEDVLRRAASSDRTFVAVIETDPRSSTAEGGAWWDVAIPQVGGEATREARAAYDRKLDERGNQA